MNNISAFNEDSTIFSTGVFLKPIECIINGKKQWRWVAVGFEDDNYYDGELIKVYVYADSFEDLIITEK